eukprot:5580015-Heterocapsa_arctica.AAC.1
MNITELSETINPYVLKETPAALSIGDRTMNKGYSFVWPAFNNPYFILPSGFRVELEVIDYIPCLRRGAAISQPTPIRNFTAKHPTSFSACFACRRPGGGD